MVKELTAALRQTGLKVLHSVDVPESLKIAFPDKQTVPQRKGSDTDEPESRSLPVCASGGMRDGVSISWCCGATWWSEQRESWLQLEAEELEVE